MPYEFYVDSSSGNDNNSGSSKAVLWSGTVSVVGTSLTDDAAGGEFTEDLIGEFVRIEPGPSSENLRIVAVPDGDTLTLAETATKTSKAAVIGGAFKTISEADKEIPAYAAAGSVDKAINVRVKGSFTLSTVLEFKYNTNDGVRRRFIGAGRVSWDDGSRPLLDFNNAGGGVRLEVDNCSEGYSLVGLEIANTTGTGLYATQAVWLQDLVVHDTGSYGIYVSIKPTILECEVYNTVNHGIWGTYNSVIVGCYAHDAAETKNAFYLSGGCASGCLAKDSSIGFFLTDTAVANNCSVVGCTTPYQGYNTDGRAALALNCTAHNCGATAVEDCILFLDTVIDHAPSANWKGEEHPYPEGDNLEVRSDMGTTGMLRAGHPIRNTGWGNEKVAEELGAELFSTPGVDQIKTPVGFYRNRRGLLNGLQDEHYGR